MNTEWPLLRLAEVARPVSRLKSPVVGVNYRQIGVRLWGVGAYERETIDGGETKYPVLCRMEAGDIIVNKIWARNGSVAVVPRSLAGCYGSSEFPAFAPDRDRLEAQWMHWLTKTPAFWKACDKQSHGSSGKNRIRPEAFLQVTIPLPPLAEQRRIVARIEALAAKIGEAMGLRAEAGDEMRGLQKAQMRKTFEADKETARVHLERVCTAIIDNLHSNPLYAEKGVPCVRSPDVGWGRLMLDSARKTTEAEYLRRTSRGEPDRMTSSLFEKAAALVRPHL